MNFHWQVTDEQRKKILEWCDALESGKYEQGKLTLHNENNDTYCCLGVLRSLCPTMECDLNDDDMLMMGDERLIGLDHKVQNYMFISEMFTIWNDSQNLSFEQIAANIRCMLVGEPIPYGTFT